MKKFIIAFLILFSIGALGAFSANNKGTKKITYNPADPPVQSLPRYTCREGNHIYDIGDFKLELSSCNRLKNKDIKNYNRCMADYNKHLSLYKTGKCTNSGLQLIASYNDTVCSAIYLTKDNKFSTLKHSCQSQQECDYCFGKIAKFTKAKHPNVKSDNEYMEKFGIPTSKIKHSDEMWSKFLAGYNYNFYDRSTHICKDPLNVNKSGLKEEFYKEKYKYEYVVKYPDPKLTKSAKCYPFKIKKAGTGQNLCQMVYFSVNKTPYIHYIGPNKFSEESNSYGTNCTQLINEIKTEHPETVLLPVVKRNLDVIQKYYSR